MEKDKILIKFQWIIIAAFIILIVLLILQNIHLKITCNQGRLPNTEVKSLSFEKNLAGKFLFKKFPIKLSIKDFFFHEEYQMDFIDGYLVMVFDFTVCGKCLHEELEVLKGFKEKINEKNMLILAIVGLSSKSEEAEIINLKSVGDIFFPCKTIPVDELYNIFHLNIENFIDTPFYMYVSHNFKVLDTFKPQYLDTKDFYKWLTIITHQDVL